MKEGKIIGIENKYVKMEKKEKCYYFDSTHSDNCEYVDVVVLHCGEKKYICQLNTNNQKTNFEVYVEKNYGKEVADELRNSHRK